MHVLYLVGTGDGGLPHYVAELANAVVEHHDVTVMKPDVTVADGLFADEVTVLEPFSSIDVSMPKIAKLDLDPITFLRGVWSYDNLAQVEAVDPDVVHEATDLFPHVKFFLRFHSIDADFPLVVTRHEVPMSRFPVSRPPILAEEVLDGIIPDLRADRVIVHTERQREAVVRRGTDPSVVRVIPHAAYSMFGSHADVEREPDPNSLLFFGNLIRTKGIDTLVEAVPLVKREIPDVRVRICGSGQIPRRVRGIVAAHPETFEIHDYFIPNEEVGGHFARSEVVVLPYRDRDGTKGHSGVLSTAFSFGKPVVASTAGEFRSMVAGTGAGVVVPPEDPRRLAEAIVAVLSDEGERSEMAARSRAMAERLSWENIAEEHVALYEDVLGEGRTGARERRTGRDPAAAEPPGPGGPRGNDVSLPGRTGKREETDRGG